MGGKSTSTSDPKINQLSIQSSSLGLPITIGWGRNRIKCNLIWYNAFTAIPHTTKQSGGKGLGGSSKNTTYTYTASVIMGLCEGPVSGIRTVYRDKDVFQDQVTTLSWDGFTYGTTTQTALQQAGLSLAAGAAGQSPWGYVTSLYPAQALGYSEIAYVYAQDYALNDSASMPNHSFEVDFPFQVSGLPDANPKDVITDFLTNARYGVPGWASGLIGDLTDYSNYCLANNLLISPVLEEQRSGSDVLTEWTEATNSAAFWSEGMLKIATFGDGTATGNGVTWTANLSPDYDLTEDDFIPDGGSPVKLEIVDQSDAYNIVQVEYLDRSNQYNVAIATADDIANITAFGQRKQDPVQYHCIADGSIAQHAAQLLVQRTLYRRDIYSFKLPWNFVLLEPMDYVTLTTTTDELQLYRQLVQIVSIDEDEDGTLSFSAEGINVGVASAAIYHTHSGSAVTVNTSVAPGSVAAPILINAPSALTEMDPEVWCAVSAPSAAWGGCDVWASADNVHFQKVGRIDGPARVGVTTGALAAHADPDTVNTLSVDLSACAKTLDGTTAANANAGATLIYVGGELMGYQNAALTSAYHYNLTTLRRGLYGTTAASHASGSGFARLDDSIFKFSYTSLNVGSTIYLKFPSFNVFGSALEDLSTVTTYSLALLGSGVAVDWRVISSAATTAAAYAQTSANAALSQLTDIANDNLLTAGEKPNVIYDKDVILGEQTGIDAQATAFAITTEKTAYDNAITALTTYLAGLTTPVLWSNLTGNTTIVGTTFRSTFEAVYSARQTLLNKIAAIAKARGDQGVSDAASAQAAATAANGAAGAAQTSANTALGQITTIVSDSILDKSEKPQVVADWTIIYNEQSGIDAQALAYGITAEKTNYDNAISALAVYLSSMSPVWYDYTTDTAIVRSVFISNFAAVYTARSALLNKIAAVAGTVANWSGVSGIPYDEILNNDDSTTLGFNGSFENWTGAYPNGWVNWTGAAPTKETAIVRYGGYAVRYAASGSDLGMLAAAYWPSSPTPTGTIVAGNIDFYLAARTSGLPGLLVRMFTNSGLTTFVDTPVQPGTAIGGWQSAPWIARVGSGQQIYGMQIFIMASWSAFASGPFTGNVIFDRLNFAFFNAGLDNSQITINANGALNGGGGGSVTISGLGFQGSLQATQNVDGANMIPDPLRYTGGVLLNGAIYQAAFGGAGARPADQYAIQLLSTNALGQWSGRIPVIPGETLYYQHAIRSDGGPGSETCNASYSYFDAAGNALGAVNLGGAPYNTSRSLASLPTSRGSFAIVSCSFVVPAGAASIIVYVERPTFTTNSFFVGEPFLGRAQPGSTLGAPAGTPIASISANDVASTVRSGGGLNANMVDTSSVQAGALVLRPVVQLASTIGGSGSSFGTVMTYSLVLAQAAKIVLSATGQHSYSGGIPDYGGAFRVDGGPEFGGTAGGAGTAIPGFSIGTTISLSAGTHTIDLRWRGGNSQITLYDAIMSIDTAMRAL